jgi:hypothetical protein
MTSATQGKFVITPVVGFTVVALGAKDEATLRIFDSHGWEIFGMGLNTGGKWHWTSEGLKVMLILDDGKTYSGLPFARMTHSHWMWAPLLTLTGPKQPWFPKFGDGSGTCEIAAIAPGFLTMWFAQ